MQPSARIVLATVGTLGDLNPFIAVAMRLLERGYEPIIASSPQYRDNVAAAGLEFHAVGPDSDAILRDLHMDLTAATRRVMTDTRFMFRDTLFPYLRSSYDDLASVVDGASLVLTSTLAFSARLAAEFHHVPCVGVVLQPMMFLSAYDPPRFAEAPWIGDLMAWLGPRLTAGVFRQLKSLVSSEAAPVRALRRELGLPPTHRDPLFDGQFSSYGTLAVYSKWLGGIQPDYPPGTAITGFAYYDGQQAAGEDAARLEAFLGSGPAPLVFALGSFATAGAGDFYSVSIDVAQRLGKRAVMLVGAHARSDFVSAATDDIFVCGAAPYSQLFPRAQCIVHHGGIGTVAQALRAGKPQLIVPFFADQVDNAMRVARLRVSQTIPRKRYNSQRATATLAAILGDQGYTSRAMAVGDEVRLEDGAEHAAHFIDGILHA